MALFTAEMNDLHLRTCADLVVLDDREIGWSRHDSVRDAGNRAGVVAADDVEGTVVASSQNGFVV